MANIDGVEIDNTQLANALLNEYKSTKQYNEMLDADRYYDVDNVNIGNKTRTYKDGHGRSIQNLAVSNARLKNAFIRKAVKQKVDYAFGKPPIIKVEPIEKFEEQTEGESKEQELYQSEWNKFLDASNRKSIKNLAHFAINCGIGYVYIMIDNGKLKLVNVPSTSIAPMWTDKTHTELNALVRSYSDRVFKDGSFQTQNRAELWLPDSVSEFDGLTGVTLIGTTDQMENAEGGIKNWNKVPFLWLKGTSDEKSLLSTVRSYIDEYDNLNSKSVDTLKDDLEAILVMKNYSSETGKLIDAYIRLKEIGVCAVDSDGGLSYLKNDPNIASIQTKLEHLKKDINEFSCTVEIQDINLGSNPSGVAIKSAFQDTDTYINDVEMEFELFIENLKYFVDMYLDMSGILPKEITSKYEVLATLNRDMMINETEILSNVVKLQGLVSQETLDDNNPYVENHEIEEQRRKQEAENDELFNFKEEEHEIESVETNQPEQVEQ